MEKQLCDEINQAYLEDFRQRDFEELGLSRKPVVMRHVALHKVLEDGMHEYTCVQVHPDDIAADGSFVVDGVRHYIEEEVGDA